MFPICRWLLQHSFYLHFALSKFFFDLSRNLNESDKYSMIVMIAAILIVLVMVAMITILLLLWAMIMMTSSF